MQGFTYILECSDGSFYTGSTKYLELRFDQHQKGQGANHTKSRLPVKLVYFEVYRELILPSTERNKYKVGVDKRRWPSLKEGFQIFQTYLSLIGILKK